jgi:hypothetical protein
MALREKRDNSLQSLEIVVGKNVIYKETNNSYCWLAKIIEIRDNYIKIKFHDESFYPDHIYPQGVPYMFVWDKTTLYNVNELLYRQYILK